MTIGAAAYADAALSIEATSARAQRLRVLLQRPEPLVFGNAWDGGSARLLAHAGFEALFSSSAGLAIAAGHADGAGLADRDAMFARVAAIVRAVDLPVCADLENGFGDTPADCALTIAMAARIGVVGGSLEDATGRASDPVYPFDLAVARVKAAVAAARELPFHFTLTARCEFLLVGGGGLDDVIERLRAYATAGADALLAPGLNDPDDIRAVVRAVAPTPLHVIAGLKAPKLSVADYAALGVQRLSGGSSLARTAYSALLRSAQEIRERGTFDYADGALSYADMNALFRSR